MQDRARQTIPSSRTPSAPSLGCFLTESPWSALAARNTCGRALCSGTRVSRR